MSVKVLIAHAKGEEAEAERLAGPIRAAGYGVAHEGTVLVGESVIAEASKLLNEGCPVVLCGTVRAMGTKWARQVAQAVRAHPGVRLFVVQMEEEADYGAVSFDEVVAQHWRDPVKAVGDLVAALRKYFPPQGDTGQALKSLDLESRYRALALKACDIVDLANLPEDDRHLASRELELRRLYVALRLRLEVRADDEVGERTLMALEERRRTGWGGPRQMRSAEKELVSLGERLGAAKRLVVLGDPGAGKSTLLRWLATAYLLRLQADPDWQALPDIASLPATDWLPILIRCRDLSPDDVTLDAMLQHTLRKSELAEEQCNALRQLLRGKLERGEALLLIDGLDEITDPGARARFAAQIETIHRAYPEAPVVATSRIVGYREMGYRIRAGFEHLTVADLRREDKDDFARRWCTLTELSDRREAAAEDLIRDIHSSDRIERLTGNPMLLTTMALIKRKIGRLPQRRVDLYEKAVEVLLNWRSAVDTSLDAREALPQLEYLAHAMCADGIQQLREDQALDLLRQCRASYPNIHPLLQHSPEEFLALLERRTGLLIQSGHTRHQGRSVPIYEFRHLTLQEYLAGVALVAGHFRGRDATQTLAQVIAPLAGQVGEAELARPTSAPDMAVVENWREALRLCLALCPDDQVDVALRGILRPLPEEPEATRPRAVLAALCLADEPNAGPEVTGEILQALVLAIRDGDGKGSVQTSLDAAVMELASSRLAEATSDALLDQFMLEPSSKQRTISGGLCSMLQEVRVRQVEGLGWLAKAASQLALCDEREATRIALTVMTLAFHAADCRVAGLAEGLIRWLSGSAAVSHSAAWALGWMTMKQPANNAVELSPAQLATLVATANREDGESETLRYLCWVFKSHRTAKAVPVLLKRLPNSPANAQAEVLQTLGEIGEDAGVAAIRAYLEDPNVSTRQAALGGLARTCEDESDRKLLSEHFSVESGWLDPLDPISEDRVAQAARRLRLPNAEIRQRYKRLAERFGLKLAWPSATRRRGQRAKKAR